MGRAGRRPAQQRGALSRTRLLDAGLEVFAELTLAELLSEIGPRRVTRRLGDVSVGAFYHHFPDRESYLAALVEQGMLAGSEEAAEEAVTPLHEVGDGADIDVLQLIEHVSRENFERRLTLGLDAFRLRACVWACRPDPVAADVLRRRYENVTAQYLAVYETMLRHWGREFRPPFTAGSALAVFHALIDGLALRYGFDPEVADARLYATTVKVLAALVTRPLDDERSVDEVVSGLGPFRPAHQAPIEDGDARRRLLDSALAAADAGTYADATFEEIATNAEVALDVAYASFRGKHALAAAAYARFLPLLARPLESDLEDDGVTPIEAIRRHLQRLADLAVRHRGLTNALLDAVQSATIRYGSHIGPSDPRAVVPLPRLLLPAVEAGQEQGAIRSDFPAIELAAVMTNLMLLRVMTRPQEDAPESARLVNEIVLFGAVPRS